MQIIFHKHHIYLVSVANRWSSIDVDDGQIVQQSRQVGAGRDRQMHAVAPNVIPLVDIQSMALVGHDIVQERLFDRAPFVRPSGFLQRKSL